MLTMTKGAQAFKRYCEGCPNLIEIAVQRRPGNALNIEIGTPADRCKLKAPGGPNMAARWLMSGGDPLAFGLCSRSTCPLKPNHCEACGHRKESHIKEIGGRCIVGGGFDNCGCDNHV